MVVDDEFPITASVKVLLKKAGHTVEVCHDGADALIKLRDAGERFQILITDHFMWKVSGVDLLEQLHTTKFKGRIIVLSGYLTMELEAKYRSLGAEQIVRKPFEPDELRQAVEALRPVAAE
jgi:DNA-binding response OmpR family regulator